VPVWVSGLECSGAQTLTPSLTASQLEGGCQQPQWGAGWGTVGFGPCRNPWCVAARGPWSKPPAVTVTRLAVL
jgi:hypothetical protein